MKLVITNERITTDLPYGELHMDKDNGNSFNFTKRTNVCYDWFR